MTDDAMVPLDPSLLLLLDPLTDPYGRIFRHTVRPTVLRALVARSQEHYRENVLALNLLELLRRQALWEVETTAVPILERAADLTVGSPTPPPTKEPPA